MPPRRLPGAKGTDYYEERYRQRVIANLRHRADALGFTLVEGTATVGAS